MSIVTLLYLIVCGIASFIAGKHGFTNLRTGDIDILLPFASSIFIFFALLIYLPEAHFKVVKFLLKDVVE